MPRRTNAQNLAMTPNRLRSEIKREKRISCGHLVAIDPTNKLKRLLCYVEKLFPNANPRHMVDEDAAKILKQKLSPPAGLRFFLKEY